MAADFNRENLDRVRTQQSRFVGGFHGREKHIQPFDPGATPVFFDEFAQLRQDSPSTVFDKGNPSRTREIKDHHNNGTEIQWQAIYRAEGAFNSVREISFPITNLLLRYGATWSGFSGFVGNFGPTTLIDVMLLKVDLFNDPVLSLDKLTWNNAFFRTTHMSGGLSALYSDSANFVAFPNLSSINHRIAGGNHTTLNPPISGGANITDVNGRVMTKSYTNLSGEQDFVTGAGLGPFTGVHLSFNTGFEGGFWVDPNTGTADSKLAVDIEGDYTAGETGLRPHALVAELEIMETA